MQLTKSLRDEYMRLFDTCAIQTGKVAAVDRVVRNIRKARSRYESVAEATGVPWRFIAAVHAMEARLRFDTHLHNGDPLTARTKRVPKNRPRSGQPPFSWEFSAEDALRLKKLDQWGDWTVPGTLYKLEGYNGFGYRMYHPEVLSPYLWSFTNHYTRGKYVGDGTFSAKAVSKQCGAVAILRRLAEVSEGEAVFDDAPAYSTGAPGAGKPPLRYTTRVLPHAGELQAFLNTFPGIWITVDGRPGRNTSDAFKRVTGRSLHGDPKAT